MAKRSIDTQLLPSPGLSEAPVLDLMSWPGPKHPLWAECLASYGMTAEQLAANLDPKPAPKKK